MFACERLRKRSGRDAELPPFTGTTGGGGECRVLPTAAGKAADTDKSPGGKRAHQIHSTFYSKREHLMAVGGGSGDVKGRWLIPSSRAQGRGTSRDAEQERQEGAVPLCFISRESAFLGSLGIMKNKS